MRRPSVLVIDDEYINLAILEEILKDQYDVTIMESGADAISLLSPEGFLPDVILLDIRMPQMNGFEVLEYLKSKDCLKEIPVIFITAENSEINGLAAGAADFIQKPFNPQVVKLRVDNQVRLKIYTGSLEELLRKKTEELSQIQGRIIEEMASIIEYRNLESGSHVKRTSELTLLLIKHMIEHSEYAQELIDQNPSALVKAVPLHDVGKIIIPDHILLKPGRLTADEFEIMKRHTTAGKKIAELILAEGDSQYLRHCMDICHYHHENFDGTGYPTGLGGKDIPLSARIVSVVDVYDALTSDRVYKSAYTHEKALQIIEEETGTKFDPVIVKCFLELGVISF